MATSACSVGAWQHAWLVRASRPCPCSNVDRASLCARVGYRWRRPRRGCWRLISDEAVLLCVRRVLDAALGASSRRCTHGAEPNPRRAPAAGVGGARARASACLHLLCSPQGRAIVSSGTCFSLATSARAAAHGIYCRALGPVLGVHRRSIWTHGA